MLRTFHKQPRGNTPRREPQYLSFYPHLIILSCVPHWGPPSLASSVSAWLHPGSLGFVADTPLVLTESWLGWSLLSHAVDKPRWLTCFKPGFLGDISVFFQGETGFGCPFFCSSEGKLVATWRPRLSGLWPRWEHDLERMVLDQAAGNTSPLAGSALW